MYFYAVHIRVYRPCTCIYSLKHMYNTNDLANLLLQILLLFANEMRQSLRFELELVVSYVCFQLPICVEHVYCIRSSDFFFSINAISVKR